MCDYDSYEPDDIRLKLEDNVVTTAFLLRGTDNALLKADEIIMRLKKDGVGPKNGIYTRLPEDIKMQTLANGYRLYIIRIDNHIPQIYEELAAISGLETPVYACFCEMNGDYYYTNDEANLLAPYREETGIPKELISELVEDYPDLYDLASTEYK